jgi:deoxyribonuclease V
MQACVDVDYREDGARAACVLFEAWTAADARMTLVERIDSVEPYEPGLFLRRELPCLMAVLGRAPAVPEVIVVDGFVWLGEECRPGLGARLYEALGGAAAVIGVAKTPFWRTPAVAVRRGRSNRPLWITAIGIDGPEAAEHIRAMHGPFRIPSLLKAVDRACRSAP